jgi:hypothetical protein
VTINDDIEPALAAHLVDLERWLSSNFLGARW